MSNPTRRTAIAITALASSTVPASLAQTPPKTTATSRLPAEIQSLIDSHIGAFNTQDNNLLFSVFGDTAIIIDGIAPFRWLNPNAPAKWMADVDKWRKDLGVTKEHLTYEMGFWNVEGSSAYAVISGILTITIKNQSIVRTGTLAYTFARRDGVWKIEAQAWGRTS
jgi:ketosteroid isomerase-like protein